jgi:2,5-dihydroxypyridine 5,6-dioxygenase
VAHWPGGLCLCFPGKNTVNGRIVMDVGDMNLTFKTYLTSRIDFTIETTSSPPSRATASTRCSARIPGGLGRPNAYGMSAMSAGA